MSTHRTPTRRQFFGSVAAAAATAAAVGVAIVTDRARRTAASTPALGGAATVGQRAVRLAVTTTTTTTTVPTRRPQSGTLPFPIDAVPDCHVLDNFGDCRSNGTRAHAGIDIITTRGREIYAVRAGVLTGRFNDTGTAGYGWTLTGDDGVTYRYMHLDGFAEDLADVDLTTKPRVSAGQVLGFAGSTGTGDEDNVHLHFEVKVSGSWVDPLPLLDLPPEATVGPPLKGCSALLDG